MRRRDIKFRRTKFIAPIISTNCRGRKEKPDDAGRALGTHAFLREGCLTHKLSIVPNPGALKELPMTWKQGGQTGKCAKAKGKDGKF